MILLRKILHTNNKIKLIKPLMGITTVMQTFSKPKVDKKKLQQIHSQLITSPNKFKPSILVRLFLNLQTNSLVKSDQLEKLLDNMDIVHLSHQSLVMLLDTISEFDRYATYNRDMQAMRLIYKRIHSMRKSLSTKSYYRLLNIMQKMQFPHSLIIRYVSDVIADSKIKKNEQLNEQAQMPRIDYIRFFITILEMNYVPIKLVDEFYEKEIKEIKFERPKQYVYIYYACKCLDRSIKQKIIHTQRKIDIKQMVYNPFASITNTSNQQQSQHKQQQQFSKQRVAQQKQTIINMCQQFKTKFRKHINIQKLKQILCKYYSFEKQHMDTSTALILIDIPQIIPDICAYLKQNYTGMQPFQFSGLLPSIPQKQRIALYNEYKDRIWRILSLQQKLSMIKIKQQRCRQSITKQDILQIINGNIQKQISLKQFNKLSIAIVTYTKPQQHLQLLRAIQALIDTKHKQ